MKRSRIEYYGTDDLAKSVFDLMLVDMITYMNLPFNFLNNHKFRKFIEKLRPGYRPITSKDLNSGLLRSFSEKIDHRREEYLSFKTELPLTIILDEWTNYKHQNIFNILLKRPNKRPVYYSCLDLTFF